MEVIYGPKALADLAYWKKSRNKTIQKKILQLIKAIQENPFEGIGKPEPLKYEHRIIYSLSENMEIHVLHILSLKGHY